MCCFSSTVKKKVQKQEDRAAADEDSDLSFHLAERKDTKPPLTCRGDAVEADKGVEAGGGAGQHALQAERSEAALAKLLQTNQTRPEDSGVTLAATRRHTT